MLKQFLCHAAFEGLVLHWIVPTVQQSTRLYVMLHFNLRNNFCNNGNLSAKH